MSKDVVTPEAKDFFIDRVEIWETWEKRDGVIYYGWRTPSEEEWHWKKTAHKGVPVVQRTFRTQKEYELLKEKS